MAYVVLARKYRPRKFEDMVGQDMAVRALGNALSNQRLHHAYLFTGTRGIGKTTVSRIFAKCLNCMGADGKGSITATPCGVCDACTQIDEDRFIDYIELDAASNRGLAETRELLDRAAYKPSTGRFKVFMIDEAHQLTKESFNALLKTLEEPPDYVKFVLATTDPQKMPATVLSRCLQFNLRPMAPSTVRDHLAKVLAAENIPFDEASLQVLGRAAQGSMRDALSLTDQAIAFGGGELKGDAVCAMLGSVGREPAAALVDALARRSGADVLAVTVMLRDQGLSPDGTLESMATLLQDMAVEQAVPGTLDNDLPDVDTVRSLALAMPADDTQLLYSIVLHGRRELSLAPDAYTGLTMVLLRLLAFPNDASDLTPATQRQSTPASPALPPSPSQPRAAAAIASPPRAMTQAPARAVEPSPPARPPLAAHVPAAAPVAVVPADPPTPAVHSQDTTLADRWQAMVTRMSEAQSITALARELAMQSALIACDEQAQPPLWTLAVEREALRAPAHQDKLTAALSSLLGAPQQLRVEQGPANDTPAQREAAAREQRAADAERVVREDPLVQAMLSQFKTARIVPGSIKPTQEPKP
jgi:DNA polymerase III subunit gamma/tau